MTNVIILLHREELFFSAGILLCEILYSDQHQIFHFGFVECFMVRMETMANCQPAEKNRINVVLMPIIDNRSVIYGISGASYVFLTNSSEKSDVGSNRDSALASYIPVEQNSIYYMFV